MMFHDVTLRGGVQLIESMAEAIKCSAYAQKLAGAAKSRYTEKITLINGLDPFLIASSGIESSLFLP